MTRIKPTAAPPFFKTGMVKQKKHRLVDEKHLAFIRTLPCLACAGPGGVAHHLTVGRYRAGRKSGDDCAVPLTARCHNDHPDSLHMVGERAFWNRYGVDPRPVAALLHKSTGDHEACLAHIKAAWRAGEHNRIHRVDVFGGKAKQR